MTALATAKPLSDRRKTAYNTGFASGGVKCKPKVYCILLPLLPADSLAFQNPPNAKPETVGSNPHDDTTT